MEVDDTLLIKVAVKVAGKLASVVRLDGIEGEWGNRLEEVHEVRGSFCGGGRRRGKIASRTVSGLKKSPSHLQRAGATELAHLAGGFTSSSAIAREIGWFESKTINTRCV